MSRVFWRKLQLAEGCEPSRASLIKLPAFHIHMPIITNGGVVKWKKIRQGTSEMKWCPKYLEGTGWYGVMKN